VEAAEDVGITGAREFLDDPNAGLDKVREELKVYARGVTGVPHFTVRLLLRLNFPFLVLRGKRRGVGPSIRFAFSNYLGGMPPDRQAPRSARFQPPALFFWSYHSVPYRSTRLSS
jgi:hypothetical protein